MILGRVPLVRLGAGGPSGQPTPFPPPREGCGFIGRKPPSGSESQSEEALRAELERKGLEYVEQDTGEILDRGKKSERPEILRWACPRVEVPAEPPVEPQPIPVEPQPIPVEEPPVQPEPIPTEPIEETPVGPVPVPVVPPPTTTEPMPVPVEPPPVVETYPQTPIPAPSPVAPPPAPISDTGVQQVSNRGIIVGVQRVSCENSFRLPETIMVWMPSDEVPCRQANSGVKACRIPDRPGPVGVCQAARTTPARRQVRLPQWIFFPMNTFARFS